MSVFSGFHDKDVLSKIKSYLDTAGSPIVELSTGFSEDSVVKPTVLHVVNLFHLNFFKTQNAGELSNITTLKKHLSS